MLTETLRFTSEKPNVKIIWWVRLKFPVLSFHGASSPPPPFRHQQSLLLFAVPCRNVSWDESEQDFQAVALLHLAPIKNAYCQGLTSPSTYSEGSPSDLLVSPWYFFFPFFFFFFLNQTTVEDMSLEGVSGGHSVQCPPPSGASQVDRVAQGRISGKRHSNPAHLFQGLTNLLGRTFKVLSALSTFIISPSFSACPRSICHCLASALIHMLLSGILCALCTRFAEALVPSLQLAHTIHPFSKRTRKKMLKNALGTECREHTWV